MPGGLGISALQPACFTFHPRMPRQRVARNIYRTHVPARHSRKARNPSGRGEIRCILRLLGDCEARQPKRQGDRLHRRNGHLPRLRSRWALHFSAQDPSYQQLHLRLPLLHQPQELERPPRPLHRGRNRAAHAFLLQTQLHRRAVPFLRHHPLIQLHDGADRRGGTEPARRS